VQPWYSAAVTGAANVIIGMEEMGGRVTTLRPADSRIDVWSGLRDDGQPANTYSADMLHFYLVLCLALPMAYPLPRGASRCLVLGVVLASVFLFHVLALIVTVENTYANALVEIAHRNYSPAQSRVYRWLYEFFAHLAIQLLPAAVLVVLFARYGGFGGKSALALTGDPGRSEGGRAVKRPGGTIGSRRLLAIAGSLVAVIVVSIAGSIHIGKVRARRSEDFCMRGFRTLLAGSAQAASTLFAKAIELKPGFLEAYDGHGSALLAAGHPDQAVAAYREALKITPGYFSSRFGLANSLESLGRGDEAIAEFEKAQVLNPARWEPYYDRALLLLKMKRIVEAEAAFKRTVELNPTMPDARFQLAKLLITTNRICEAVPHLEAYLSLDPASEHAPLVRSTLETGRKECTKG
jgi:Tfp pilus assembly protein PilF